jgi:hypothetical protein
LSFNYLRQYQVSDTEAVTVASGAQLGRITNIGEDPVFLVNQADEESGTFNADTWYELAPGSVFYWSLPEPASEFVVLAQCAEGFSSSLDVFAY